MVVRGVYKLNHFCLHTNALLKAVIQHEICYQMRLYVGSESPQIMQICTFPR